MREVIVTIDGPAGVGKGTIAALVAKKLNFMHVDSGIYYRALAYLVKRENTDINDEDKILAILNQMQIKFDEKNIILNQEDVTNLLRTADIDKIAAIISCYKEIRLKINKMIKTYINKNNVVIDGRDAGTVIYPDADVKIFLEADINIRAKRRLEQYYKYEEKNDEILAEIIDNMEKRDRIDKQKEFGALVVAKDAIIIDTSNKNIEEIVNEICNIIKGEVK